MAIERNFSDRHIGPTHRDELAMLKALGYTDLASFIGAVVPSNIAIKGVIEASIDGGVSESNASALATAGADVLVAGTTVFKAADPIQMIASLRNC